MVKGVSKTVIEVNNTGSKLFEKIVFYVTPEYGNLSAKQLKKAASTFAFYHETLPKRKSLRKRYKWRKKRIALICGGVVALVVGTLIFLL